MVTKTIDNESAQIRTQMCLELFDVCEPTFEMDQGAQFRTHLCLETLDYALLFVSIALLIMELGWHVVQHSSSC